MFPPLPLAFAMCLSASGPAVAIVEVDSPEVMMGLGAQVTGALRAAAEAQGLSVVSPEVLRTRLEAKKYETLRKCGGNPACVVDALGSLGVERVVLGRLNRDERNYLLKLWLVDVRKGEVIADVDRAILIAARRFQKDVEQAVPPLLRGEREARGTLTIEANVSVAQVSLNGDFVGAAPMSLSLKPGKYEVKVERRKYLSVTRWLAVEAEQETREIFRLLLKPGEIDDEQQLPALTKEAPKAAEPQVSISAPTWIAGGAAVAAGGAGLGLGLLMRSQDKRLLDSYNPQTQRYGATRRQALAAQDTALMANVAFGVAGACLVATVVSLVLDVRSAGTLTVAPAPAVGGAGAVLGGTW